MLFTALMVIFFRWWWRWFPSGAAYSANNDKWWWWWYYRDGDDFLQSSWELQRALHWSFALAFRPQFNDPVPMIITWWFGWWLCDDFDVDRDYEVSDDHVICQKINFLVRSPFLCKKSPLKKLSILIVHQKKRSDQKTRFPCLYLCQCLAATALW